MATKLRILIRWGGLPRRFLSLVFRDGPAEDGTLLISLDRKPTLSLDVELGRIRPPIAPEPPLQPFKITRHATGCVRFHGFDRGAPRRIFAEPIFAISQAQPLAIVSIPHPDVLTVFDEIAGPFDAELDLSSADLGRKTFYLSLLPDSDQLPELSGTGASVRFADWFRVGILLGPPPTPPFSGLDHAVWKCIPSEGPFPAQVVDKNHSLVFVHRKLAKTQDSIFYWLPARKKYRLIFAVPMRIAPHLEIEFEDPKLKAVVTPNDTMDTRFSELTFSVSGPGGRIPNPVVIKRIMLHADL